MLIYLLEADAGIDIPSIGDVILAYGLGVDAEALKNPAARNTNVSLRQSNIFVSNRESSSFPVNRFDLSGQKRPCYAA